MIKIQLLGLVALLPLVFLDGAYAQSTAKVYGVIDTATQLARKGGSTVTTQESGTSATSRLGFTGTEDLGGGLQASFWLEAGLRVDGGTAGGTTAQGDASFFNRQSNVSLKSPDWGEVRLGRQFPPQILLAFDTFNGVFGFSPYASLSSVGRDQGSGTSVGDTRVSRAISYTTPEQFALGASVLVAARNSGAAGFPRTSALGTEVHYFSGRLMLQAQYLANNTDPTATLASFRNEWWGIGAMYKFDSVTVSYIGNVLVPKRASYLNSQTHAINLTIPFGVATVRISPVYRSVQGRSDLTSFALGLGYDHNLSKRTSIYARTGYVANRSNAIATIGTATLAKAGDDLPIAAIGVNHRF